MYGLDESVLSSARAAASETPGLRLLLLFGSRADGSAHAASDWDFGYLAEPGAPIRRLQAELIRATNSERVDLVDLGTASALLRYRAAASGRTVFERHPGERERFWLEAVDFWCDAQSILIPAYDRVLERLGP
jgi:predicted nucleotidyltransferase